MNTTSTENESLLENNSTTSSQTFDQVLAEQIIIVEEEKEKFKEETSNSLLGAVFNLVNATIGAGILGVPFVFKQTGLLFGLMFLCVGAVAGVISLSYLRAAHKIVLEEDPNAHDYEDIGQKLYGKFVAFLVKFSVVFINFSGTLTYTIIIGRLTSKIWGSLLGSEHFLTNVYYSTLLMIVPAAVLTMLKKMSQIRFISYLSLTVVFVFVAYLTVGCITGILGEREGEVHFAQFNISMLRVLGIVTFAFSAHTNLIPIHAEFKIEESPKMGYAIIFNILIDLLIYSACGVLGYLSFLDLTKGNLLESFDFRRNHNVMFTGVFCITIFLTYPMTVFPSRISLDNIIKSIWNWKIKETDPRPKIFKEASYFDQVHEFLWQYFPDIRFVLETIVLLGFAYLLAVIFPNVENVLSLTGSTASTMTSYIFPATFYIKATKNGWFHWSTIGAIFVLLYGLLFGTCVTTISVLTYFEVISV